jgi:hypothetical protein
MKDIDIFKKWLETSLAKHIVNDNSQIAVLLEFARYYHKIKTNKNKKDENKLLGM